jgi:sugar/nucleoside kinase (ribokinase family)
VPARFDLLVLGDANPDLILAGDVVPRFGQVEQVLEEAVLTVGGSGAITACGAARLGLRVAFCAVVGDDVFGTFMRQELASRGVAVDGITVLTGSKTGLTVVLSRTEDRASLTLPGTIASLEEGMILPDLLASARHVHVSQYFMQDALRPGLPGVLGQARSGGATTSLDPNWDPSETWDAGLRELLPLVDVFLPNAAEVAAIAGLSEPREAAASLAEASGLVVVKEGAEGSFAVRGSETIEAPAVEIAQVVDTTGAGDSFDAGFLAAYLAGEDVQRSLHIANACGALSTRALGGVEAQPTMQEALAGLDEASV